MLNGSTLPESFPVQLRGLACAAAWPHPIETLSCIETHISWVLLTGKWAYKIKKPVAPGFLDFSTLDRRHHFCMEELRINRHFTDGLYDAVVPISDLDGRLSVGCDSNPIEYAVRMHQFPATSHVTDKHGRPTLSMAQVTQFGRDLATSHEKSPSDGRQHATPDHQINLVRDAIKATEDLVREDPLLKTQVNILKPQLDRLLEDVTPIIRERYSNDRVRECHGDLHLDNVIVLDGRVIPFDALEFDPGLRWTDVCADVAFLMMDLEAHGAENLSHAFLSAWLDSSGDFGALQVLRFFKLYRALVRARVNAISMRNNCSGKHIYRERLLSYLALARRYAEHNPSPQLYVMRGLSGSGKSWFAHQLASTSGMIVIRSDVERRRRPAVSDCAMHDGDGSDTYSEDSRDSVYQLLRAQARLALTGGFSVLLDATHLQEKQIDAAKHLAIEFDIPFLVIYLYADYEILADRVEARTKSANDASDATVDVLQMQYENFHPLTENNLPFELAIKSDNGMDIDSVSRNLPFLASRPNQQRAIEVEDQ